MEWRRTGAQMGLCGDGLGGDGIGMRWEGWLRDGFGEARSGWAVWTWSRELLIWWVDG
mgnify:CR=1 FL=1